MGTQFHHECNNSRSTQESMNRVLTTAMAALVLGGCISGAHAQKKQAAKSGDADIAKLKAALKDPANLKEQAPAKFNAKFVTSKGEFVVSVTRSWSPAGADRFYTLVKHHYFDGVKFFRVVPNFVVQFGIHGDPSIATKWLQSNINDDPVVQSNKRGFLTYAKSSLPNSRSVQLFINLRDNVNLDSMQFAPFGKIVKGMEVVDALYNGYAEGLTQLQGQIAEGGNKFLDQNFPKLDGIKTATVVP